eukprot:8429768-Prorocentrum_lima.AAC.1
MELPFFKMIGSWRPEHSVDDPQTLLEEEGKEPVTVRRAEGCAPSLRWAVGCRTGLSSQRKKGLQTHTIA